MASNMGMAQKLTAASRLADWKTAWADRSIDRLTMLSKHMTDEDYAKLEKMLRRIKRT